MQKVSYMGDGSTTEFNFNFPYFENSNIVVTKNNAATTGYTIIGTSGGQDADIPYTGGKVVFDVAPSELDNITIQRQLPLERVVDYQQSVKINPTTLNQDMNYTIELLKDLSTELNNLVDEYNDIANKESTQTLLTRISRVTDKIDDFHEEIENGRIMSKSDFYSYATNCLTAIPQNIKCELSAGQFILKAGSKVYVPNGTNKFNVVTIANDLTLSSTSVTDNNIMIAYNSNSNTLLIARMGGTNNVCSGTIADRPAASSMAYGAGLYYASDENKLYMGNKGANTWTAGASFPVAIAAVDGANGYVTIKEVFNSFGYIGSTLFVLPGIKGLIPNKRKTDGTLNNTEFTIDTVKTKTQTDSVTQTSYMVLNANEINDSLQYTESESQPSYNNVMWYDTINNVMYSKNSSGVLTTQNSCYIGTVQYTSGKITSVNFKNAFDISDNNDADFIANQSMPSSRYTNLTLGVSDSTYTASANGFVFLKGQTTAASKAYGITNESNGMSTLIHIENSGDNFGIYLPVSRGQTFSVKYESALASGYTFRFVYANGAK